MTDAALPVPADDKPGDGSEVDWTLGEPEVVVRLGPGDPVPGKCNAVTNSPDRHLCRNVAGKNTGHLGYGACWRHSGTTPNSYKHAARLQLAELVQRMGKTYTGPIDAEEELLNNLRRAKAMVEQMGELVNLAARYGQPDSLEGADPALLAEVTAVYGADHLGDLRMHPLQTLLQAWMVTHRQAAVDCVKMGLAKHQLRIEDEKVELAAQAFFRTVQLPEAALTYQQRQLLISQFSENMRAIEAPSREAER